MSLRFNEVLLSNNIFHFSKVQKFDTFLLTHDFIDFCISDGLINTDATTITGCLVGRFSLIPAKLPPPSPRNLLLLIFLAAF
jgi:hypothetical protein